MSTRKKLTREEQEELEAARLAEETRLAEEAAEEARYKFVIKLDFNETTNDPLPSTSPRDQLSYRQDKKQLKEYTKFTERHPELESLLILFHTEVIRKKPNNIVRFATRYFFNERNEDKLRAQLKMANPQDKK